MSIVITEAEDSRYLDEIVRIDELVFGSSKWGRKSFEDNIKNPYDLLLVAVEDGRVRGYGLLRMLDIAELLMIAVDPSDRRRGAGSALTEGLIAEAGRREMPCIELEVRESNLPAISMYEKYGFTRERLRRDYYSGPLENGIIMRLTC